MVPLIVDGQKDGNELVSAFTDLASNTFETYVVAKLEQSFLPCQRVEIHRVQKRAVQIEDCGFRQLTALHVRITAPSRIGSLSAWCQHLGQARHQKRAKCARSIGKGPFAA